MISLPVRFASISLSFLSSDSDSSRMLFDTANTSLQSQDGTQGTLGLNTAIRQTAGDITMNTVDQSLIPDPALDLVGQELVAGPVNQPRTKPSLLAKLLNRNRDRTPNYERALEGSLLAPFAGETSPVDGSLEVIQPGTLYNACTSPDLRPSVSLRQRVPPPLSGSRYLEDALPVRNLPIIDTIDAMHEPGHSVLDPSLGHENEGNKLKQRLSGHL